MFLGATLTIKNARSLAKAFRAALRTDSRAKYLAAAIKAGIQAEVITLHDEEALADFIAHIKNCYGDEPIELNVIDLSEEKHAMITENLGELRLH